MSKSDMPPVPPAGRSDKGPGETGHAEAGREAGTRQPPDNLGKQDRQGNIKQNTRHQGYQQDR